MHYKIIGIDHKLVVNVKHSKIGYCYPNIYFETIDPETGEVQAINLDCYLSTVHGMSHDDLLAWYSDAEPATIENLIELTGMQEGAFRGIINEITEGGE